MSGHSPNPAGVSANDLNTEKIVTCKEHRRPGERFNDKTYRKALVKKVRQTQPSGPVDSNGDPVKFANTEEVPASVRPKGGVLLNGYSPLLIQGPSLAQCYVYSWRTTWALLNKKTPEGAFLTEDRSGHINFGLLKLPKGSAVREKLLLWQQRAARRLALRESRLSKTAPLPGEWVIVPGSGVPSSIKLPAGHARDHKQVKDIFERAKKGRRPTKKQVRLLDPPKKKKKKQGGGDDDEEKKFFYALNPYGSNAEGRAILVWNLPNRERGGAVIAVLSQKDVFFRADIKPICLKAVVYNGPSAKLALAEAIFVYGHVNKAYGYARPKGNGLRAATKGKKLYGWMLASIADGKNNAWITTLRNQSAPGP
jgi:hypothetical protein